MSGRWSAVDAERAPAPTATTRLQLEGHGLVSQLSAMTVVHGGQELFDNKRVALGEDPLRSDADPEALWARVAKSSKSIGQLCMDQTFFAGVGNIFRCEILLVAGIHPDTRGSELTRVEFDRIWAESVRLMTKAFTSGSIVTVDKEEALAVGKPKLRRWLYNSATCGKCGGPVTSWQIQARTCYACAACQPLPSHAAGAAATPASNDRDGATPKLFLSHCAAEPLSERLRTPAKLRVAELRELLAAKGLCSTGKKAELVARLAESVSVGSPSPSAREAAGHSEAAARPQSSAARVAPTSRIRSARAAAADKAAVNESRSVEHIAEYEDLEDDAAEWLETPTALQTSPTSTPRAKRQRRT